MPPCPLHQSSCPLFTAAHLLLGLTRPSTHPSACCCRNVDLDQEDDAGGGAAPGLHGAHLRAAAQPVLHPHRLRPGEFWVITCLPGYAAHALPCCPDRATSGNVHWVIAIMPASPAVLPNSTSTLSPASSRPLESCLLHQESPNCSGWALKPAGGQLQELTLLHRSHCDALPLACPACRTCSGWERRLC